MPKIDREEAAGRSRLVLHVTIDFSARGGAEAMMARLINARPERPAMVVGLKGVSESCRSLIDHPDVRFESLGARSALGLGWAAFRLARIIRKERPAAVVCWMYHASVIGTLAAGIAGYGGRVFWNIRHSWDEPGAESLSTRVAVWLGCRLRSKPHGMIFNSRRALEQHASIGYRHPNARFIPNGYILPARADTSAPRSYRVGMAARFHPQKDFSNFLSAAALVLGERSDIQFLAAGRGVSLDNPEFGRLVATTGAEKVQLLGEVANMADFYRSLDCFVLSSSFGEGFPNVLAEAMSHGVPCVTTDVGDAAYVVGDTGKVVPPRAPEALAQALQALLADAPEAYMERRAAARNRVEQLFEIETVVRQYEEFLFAGSGT